eukprot:133296-Rhodomonas_salina.1
MTGAATPNDSLIAVLSKPSRCSRCTSPHSRSGAMNSMSAQKRTGVLSTTSSYTHWFACAVRPTRAAQVSNTVHHTRQLTPPPPPPPLDAA